LFASSHILSFLTEIVSAIFKNTLILSD